MEIRENRIGILTYTIQVNNQEGEVLEEATIDQPRTMLFGTGRLLKSFDEKLLGLRSGDRFEFVLSPDECFGAYQEELVMDLPKTAFMINGQLKPEALEIGRTVPMVDSDGNPFDGKVISVHTDTVRMDFNHPLAGKHLFTRGAVLHVREATEEELNPSASSCGCGSGSDSCCGGNGGQQHNSNGGCGCGCSDSPDEAHACECGCNESYAEVQACECGCGG